MPKKMPTRFWSRPRRDAGFSLVGALVGLSIVGMLAASLSQVMTGAFKANRSVQDRSELNLLRQVINSRLDCGKTVGSSGAVCDGAPITLRDSQNNLIASGGHIGDWSIQANCPQTCDVNANNPGSGASDCNQVVVTAKQAGNDPLTGLARDATKTNKSGTTVAKDLFGGLSSFCSRSYGGVANSGSVTLGSTFWIPTTGTFYNVLSIKLPRAGNYMVYTSGQVAFTTGWTPSVGGGIDGRFMNATTGTAYTDSARAIFRFNPVGSTAYSSIAMIYILEVNAPTTITFQVEAMAGTYLAKNVFSNPSGGGGNLGVTMMGYVKIQD